MKIEKYKEGIAEIANGPNIKKFRETIENLLKSDLGKGKISKQEYIELNQYLNTLEKEKIRRDKNMREKNIKKVSKKEPEEKRMNSFEERRKKLLDKYELKFQPISKGKIGQESSKKNNKKKDKDIDAITMYKGKIGAKPPKTKKANEKGER